MKKAVFLFAAGLAAAGGAGAEQFIVGVDAGDFAHPFSGC
jgi:hypothetical protein